MGTIDKILSWVEGFGQSTRIAFALAVVLFAVVVTEYIVSLNTQQTIVRERAATVEQLATIRARLEGEVNSTLHLTRGMISYVATHPDITWTDFEPLAAEIVAVGRHIRNIALAPDNVVQFTYPLAGNERAMGLDYRKLSKQWPAVERAIAKGSTVVAGPVNLVQGGQGLIARTPIYVRDHTGFSTTQPQYWGLAAIVLNVPSLFDAAGVEQRIGNLSLAIRGKDGLGAKGEMIFGEAKLFATAGIVTQTVTMPNGTWQLAAMPSMGWGSTATQHVIVRTTGLSIALIFGVLVFLLLSLEQRNRDLALHDHLTKLPNRRLMYDRLYQLVALSERAPFGFTLLYIDLDEFKRVNDRYGHHMGDKVLVETGARLMALTRKTDTVARMGGDEFIVLLPGVRMSAPWIIFWPNFMTV
ncbi:MAG: sensor domain-containing diguanylate cyclase [Magnetovibrio sp.]|nr:sensor domain-containing diguanylate cyclase [Magnetovibrio sp.]